MKPRIPLGALQLGCALLFPLVATAQETAKAGMMPEPADFIIYNAKVLTVNSDFTVAQSIAVLNGRIEAVGRDRQLEEYQGPLTRMIDAGGRTVMPGLYDASVHSYQAAVSELKGPRPVIESIEGAQKYIREQASNRPAGSWIVLDGLFPTRLKEGRLPTKAELDAATTNVPVYWNFGTIAIVNSKALEVSKITRETQAPHGSEVEKDPKHFKPTGVLRNASKLLKLPPPEKPPTRQQEREALKKLYHLYNETGITSIVEKDAATNVIDLFREMSRSNELTVRISASQVFQPGSDLDETIDRLDALTNVAKGKLPYGPTGTGDNWVRIGALETVLDGNLDSGTAYLRTPYGIGPTYKIDEPAYHGEIKQDSFILPEVYLEAAKQGWQVAAHCSGDAALDFALNSFEKVQFKQDIRDRRFLITHSDFQAEQDWERSTKLGLGAVLEPGDIYQDGSVLRDTLGTNRLKLFVPAKSWLAHGTTIGGASDHLAGLDSLESANPWNPWLALWTVITRETKQGATINADESLTREQAVRMYTLNNAWLNFEENDKGSLEPGKLADLILIDQDIMKCPVSDIRDTKVLLTMVDGRIVWEAKKPAAPVMEPLPQAVTVNVTNAATPVVPAKADATTTASAATISTEPATSATAAAASTAASKATINPYAPLPVTHKPSPAISPAQSAVAQKTLEATVGKADLSVAPPVSGTAAAAEAEVGPVTSSATPASTANQPTVVTVSNQTTSVTVTIQPTMAATASDNPTVTVTNQATSVVVTNEIAPAVVTNSAPLGAVPVETSPSAATTPPSDAAQPAASASQTNQPSAAVDTDAKTSSTTSTNQSQQGLDWSHLFGLGGK